MTLLLFPSVGIAQPYQFTENLDGLGDWLLPGLIVLSGTFLNTRFTGRMPLILGWVVGFVFQAWARHLVLGAPLSAMLLPLTGMSMLLFTFYMISDPGTTPCGAAGAVRLRGGRRRGVCNVDGHAHRIRDVLRAPGNLFRSRGLGLWAQQFALSWRDRRSDESRLVHVSTPVSLPRPQPLEVALR